MGNWKSKNRHKFLLQYHLIFVCKYRKKLLFGDISDDIKQLSYDICTKHNINIKHMETDVNVNLSNIVRLLKLYTTYNIWERHSKYLSKHFWKERTFWTDGYFICSIGNVSEKTLANYIDNQG